MAIHSRDYLDCVTGHPRLAIHPRDYLNLDCTLSISQDILGWLSILGTTWTVDHPCLRISQDGYPS